MFYVRYIFCVLCLFCVVTDDPGSKPDQKHARRRDRQNYIRKNEVQLGLGAKDFRFVYNILVQCVGADFKVIGIKFMAAFIMRRDAASF